MTKFERFLLGLCFCLCIANSYINYANNKSRENILRESLSALEILTERHNEAVTFINSLNKTCEEIHD